MLNPEGVVIRESMYPVDETIDRLVSFLQNKGATIYARINQQTELNGAGLHILPLQFILFGNPQTGGPIMAVNPIAALDLPLKIIAWEDDHKKVWIAYNDAQYLEHRYALTPAESSSLNLDGLVKAALKL